MDRENKNDHFINLDLSDYSFLFGQDKLIKTLDALPKPDIILSSPPCESWSIASAMRDGNACWKQERGDSLFEPQVPLSRFTIRDFKDYEGYQFNQTKSLVTRINGELTIFNTVKIIENFKPKVFVIENPAYGSIWDYIHRVLGFEIPFENLTYYNNYNNYPIKKPTKFGSNIDLKLRKNNNIKNLIDFDKTGWSYNERSNIPKDLVEEIIEKSIRKAR